jgi:hypothetical protein
MACFYTKGMFMYQVHVSNSRACLNSRFLVHFTIYSLFLWLYVFVYLCFIISIHSKNIHPKITFSFCRFLCFMYYIFNIYHIFIGYTSFMFYVPRLFLRSDFFVLFLTNWLGGTSREAPSSENVKNITAWANPPKPKLHASLSPWMEIQLWWQYYYCFGSSVKEN